MIQFEALKRMLQKMNRGIAFGGMFLLIPMMLLTTADVIGRSYFRRPITGTYELSSYLLAVFILLGVAYTYQVGGHVRVTMFVSRLPARIAIGVSIITTLLSLFIIAVLAWQGWVLGWEEKTVSEQLRIPELPFRLLVFLAAVSLGIELLIDLVTKTAQFLRGS
ncbi:MAG: TRAP transporter small permease [Desulfobacterales bacterium]